MIAQKPAEGVIYFLKNIEPKRGNQIVIPLSPIDKKFHFIIREYKFCFTNKRAINRIIIIANLDSISALFSSKRKNFG